MKRIICWLAISICFGIHGASMSTSTTENKDQVQTINLQVRVGGMQSLSRAQKDGCEIVIIGYIQSPTFAYTPLKTADEEAKKIVLAQLEKWSTQEESLAYLTFELEKTCHQHAEEWKKLRESPAFYLPLNQALLTLGALTNFTHNNLRILCMPPLGPYNGCEINPTFFLSREFFPLLAQQAQFPAQDIQKLGFILSLYSKPEKKRFFGKNSPFSKFVSVIEKTFSTDHSRPESPILTVKKYYTLLDYMIARAEELTRSSTDKMIIARATELTCWLEQTKEDVESYFALFSFDPVKSTLVDALCTCIATYQDFRKAITEFVGEVSSPFMIYQKLTKDSSVVKQVEQHKRLFLILPHDQVRLLISFLLQAGYDVSSMGNLPKFEPGKEIEVGKSPFLPTTIREFLSSCFDRERTGEKPELPQDSPIRELLPPESPQEIYEEFITEKIRAKGENLESKKQIIREFKAAECPEQKSTLCTICEKPLTRNAAQMTCTANKEYCSLSCLTKHVTTTHAPSWAALLSQDEKPYYENLPQKVAALCYLRFMTLSPGTRFIDSALYSLDCAGFARKLLFIIEEIEYPLWKHLQKTTQELFIDLNQLSIFLRIYDKLKDSYKKDLINHGKLRARTKGINLEVPVFDPSDSITKLQTKQYTDLQEVLSAIDGTPHSLYPRLYYTLAKKLSQPKKLTPELLKSLFS